jgi:hypothetical protein
MGFGIQVLANCFWDHVSVLDKDPVPFLSLKFGIRDPGWVKNQDPDLVSGIWDGYKIKIRFSNEHPRSYFRELRNIYADPDLGSGIYLTLDPGWKKFGSGINIPDPQHWIM